MITLAAPEITGLDPAMLGVLAAAALAAALVTADGPLAAIVVRDRSATRGQRPMARRPRADPRHHLRSRPSPSWSQASPQSRGRPAC